MRRKITDGSGKSDRDEVFIWYYNKILGKVEVRDPVEDRSELLLVVCGMLLMFCRFTDWFREES